MNRDKDDLEALARRLGNKYPAIHFEVEHSLKQGYCIVFEHGDTVIRNPARDILADRRVSPLYYGLDYDSVRVILDANGLREPGVNVPEDE